MLTDNMFKFDLVKNKKVGLLGVVLEELVSH